MDNITASESIICADPHGMLILIGAYFGGWLLSKAIDVIVYKNKSTLTENEQNLLRDIHSGLEALEKNQDRLADRLEDMQKTQMIVTTVLEELVRKTD